MQAEVFDSTAEEVHVGDIARPFLSVIVPVYNSTGFLQKCLTSLSRSEYQDYEVIVVDDGSTEPIQAIVEDSGFRYVRIEGPGGPARARNHGARIAAGRYLVFIDADVCVESDVLSRFSEIFVTEPAVAAVIGSYDEAPAEPNFLSQYKNLFHHYVHQQSDGPVNTFWSGCGAMDKDIFLSFGGFDEQRYRRPAIEDIELGTWVSAAGHRILLDSQIKAKHLKRWTLLGLCRTDIFDRGVPWTRLMLRAGAMANTLNVKPSQRLSVALSGLTVLSILPGFFNPWLWLIPLGLFLTVTAINLDFYRFFARRSGWLFALRVVPLHWIYFWYCGFSFVLGTILHHFERPAGNTPSSTASESKL